MRYAILSLLALTAAACTDQPTAPRHTGSFRVLPTISLIAGQRADITPSPQDRYDSLLTASSSAITFLGMDTVTFFLPEGPGPQEQIYHLRADTSGRVVLTIRFADGTPAVQDTILVLPSTPHGPFSAVNVGLFLSSCATTTTTAGDCWGWHADLGDSANDRLRTFNSAPMPLPDGLDVSSISLGGQHGCALTTTGAAYCWGANFNGQLGDGTTDSAATPVAVTGGLVFKAVSAGVYHTCGLTTAGAIYCWGNDISGELGNDTTDYINSRPILVSDSLTFKSVIAGYQYSCGLTTAGAAYCWGDNDAGVLGIGTTISSHVPVPVVGGVSFASLSGGYVHACGLTGSGAAYCWGGNFTGELGSGPATPMSSCGNDGPPPFTCSPTPVAVTGGLTFAELSAGQWATCGVTTDAHAYCWGYNGAGQLGNEATPVGADQHPNPLLVSGGLSFSTVSTGYLHTCGITTEGVAYCWGDNSEGELGDGSTMFHATPVPVFSRGP